VFRLDEVIQAQPLDPLHDEVRLALEADSVFVSPHDIVVAESQADFPLTGLLHPLESGLKLLCLELVEQFEADIAAEFAVIGAEHLGHTPLPGPPAQLESLLDVA